jgi:hypothetical protein
MRLLGQVLETEAELADFQRRRERELRLQLQLRRGLPPALATHVRVADTRSYELEIVAASGAAAALLRQRAPDLLRKLAGEGWEFTGIRVRVQARPAAPAPEKPPTKQLDAAAGRALEALAQRLGDAPLAQALRRLARHAGPEATGSDGGHQPLEGVKDQDAEQ